MSERDKNPVVAVCGNEATIYGDATEKTGIRPFRRMETFTNYGQALMFAREYGDKPKPTEKRK